MTVELLVLDGRIVTDDGTVVFEYDTLVELARDGVAVGDLTARDTPEIRRYNQLVTRPLRVWEDDGDIQGPPAETYQWTTPEPYDTIDIWAHLRECCPDTPGYRERLEQEIRLFEWYEMTNLVRHIAWMVGDFKARGVVWGVGRGSSCASLVMYLVGLNLIDPLEYDLPLEEFFKNIEPWNGA